jgi:hypothetical protein
MKTPIAALAAIVLLSSCGGNQAVQLDERDDSTTRWSASMSSPPTLAGAVQMNGTAWMAEADSNATRVHVSIENAAPGGRHPWMVQRGRCGADRGMFGTEADYQPLQVSGNGTATATTVVNERLPSTGTYSVTVLASPSNQDLVVACGNLAPPVALPY